MKRLVLDVDDFNDLVVSGTMPTEIILSDIGWDVIYEKAAK